MISQSFSFSNVPREQAALRRTSAPSSSEQLPLSPRQTEALLPTELVPAGGQAEQQDVLSKKQEQSRLVDDIQQMAEKANVYLQQADTHLEFKVSDETGRVIISVVESDSQAVIRQIPPESLARMADGLSHMRGLLFEING